MVGAILVHKHKIIGQGYHQVFGEAHAEVNCLKSVSDKNKHLIRDSTLYVTLEPCCIINKTPACTDLIIKAGIKKLVISVKDPNPKVAGKGIKILQNAGIEITQGILETQGEHLIQKFRANLKQRPHVTIKFAQSFDRYISSVGENTKISNEHSDIFVHQLRANNDAILIGTNTAKIDNPKLTTRLVEGDNPVRIILDKNLSLDKNSHVFKDDLPSLFINEKTETIDGNKNYIKLDFDENLWSNLWNKLFDLGIYSILIEGGAQTIKTLVKTGLWDQAYVITSDKSLNDGIKAPTIKGSLIETFKMKNNKIHKVFRAYEC